MLSSKQNRKVGQKTPVSTRENTGIIIDAHATFYIISALKHNN